MPQISIVARVTVHEGRVDEYVEAFGSLFAQVEQEPGTLLYAIHRSNDDPLTYWTTEVYADEAAFDAHRASDAHAAATPVFGELIAESEFMIGETVMTKRLVH